jgi:hypothetical protein
LINERFRTLFRQQWASLRAIFKLELVFDLVAHEDAIRAGLFFVPTPANGWLDSLIDGLDDRACGSCTSSTPLTGFQDLVRSHVAIPLFFPAKAKPSRWRPHVRMIHPPLHRRPPSPPLHTSI